MNPKRKRKGRGKDGAIAGDVRSDEPAEMSAAERYEAYRQKQQKQLGTATAEFADSQEFILDDFQMEACAALERGHSVLVAAPTGAGKTIVADFAVTRALAREERLFYTTPIKALSNQKYRDLCLEYGDDQVGLLTGDVAVNADAPIVVMTTEVLRNMLYTGSTALDRLGFVVLDEVHYLADRFRGPVWEEVILHLDPHVLIVALSATVSNAEQIGHWLENVRGHCDVIISERRPVPLVAHMVANNQLLPLFKNNGKNLNPQLTAAAARQSMAGPGRGVKAFFRPASRARIISLLEQAKMLPAIYFIFSRSGCEQAVTQLVRARLHLTSPDERGRIREISEYYVGQIPASDYGALGIDWWLQALEDGVAAHHAGLLPIMKECVEELFSAGLLKVVFATETLALGINMPARTVVVESLQKWDGTARVALSPGEFTQLTGRAGRRGIDPIGFAVVPVQSGVTPPRVAALASKRSYALTSAFRPTFNMAVNLLQRTNYKYARSILERSLAQFQADAQVSKSVEAREQWQHKADDALKKMACDRGDFAAYMQLSQELDALRKAQRQQRTAPKRLRHHDQFASVKVGDVISYRRGRQRAFALVTQTDTAPAGYIVLSTITSTGNAQQFTAGQLGSDCAVVGHMNLRSSTKTQSARDRAKLAGALKAGVRDGIFSAEGQKLSKPVDFQDDIERLHREISNHPCHSCPDKSTHLEWARKAASFSAQVRRLNEVIEHKTGTIAKQFDGVCGVLRGLGYLDEDNHVTEAGRRLARLYCENDLLVDQLIQNGVWDQLPPAELAAAVSAVLGYDRGERGMVIPASLPRGLTRALEETEAHFARLVNLQRDLPEQIHVEPTAVLAAAVLDWARNKPLSDCLETAEIPAGDFVRMLRQLLDLLGQLASLDQPQISEAARAAMKLLRHGVVAWSEL